MNLIETKLQNAMEELRLARDEIHRLKARKVIVRDQPFDKRNIIFMAREMCDEIAGDINDGSEPDVEYARGSIEMVTVLMDEVNRLRGCFRVGGMIDE